MGYNLHDVLNKIVVNITLKNVNLKNITFFGIISNYDHFSK